MDENPVTGRDLVEGDVIEFHHRKGVRRDAVERVRLGRTAVRIFFRSGLDKMFPASSLFSRVEGSGDDTPPSSVEGHREVPNLSALQRLASRFKRS